MADQGAEAMLHRARDMLYWPRMAEAIQQMFAGCRVRVLHSPANGREPLMNHGTPKSPLTKVALDVF